MRNEHLHNVDLLGQISPFINSSLCYPSKKVLITITLDFKHKRKVRNSRFYT